MTSISFDITLLDKDEVFYKLSDEICDTYHLSRTRYICSNRGRIFDTAIEKFILLYPAKTPYYLLYTKSNTLAYVRIDKSKLDNPIFKSKTLSGYCILDRELVIYIRSAYYSKEKTIDQLFDELNISRFSFNFAVGENFVMFENSCEIRDNDIEMSLMFMEAVVIITNTNPKLRIKTVSEMVCEKMGIEHSKNIYNKVSGFYAGRSSYIYIPKNVQRLVDKT